MSVQVVKSDSEVGLQCQSQSRVQPVRRPPGPSKKSLATRLWDVLQPLARLWGLISAVALPKCFKDSTPVIPTFLSVLSGAGTHLLMLGHEVAPVLIAGSALILILETMWVVALFVDLLCRRGDYTLPLRCWDYFRWSCGRARAPFYACAATALMFANLTLLATVAGGMLLVLAALRAAVPFSPYATHGPHSPRAGSSLLSQHDSVLPDVFYNAAQTDEDRSEEMTVLSVRSPDRSRSVTPKPSLLEL